ncbi:MAG: 2-oxoacid:ferredoxin oxidoreductase subunit gamma [Deltaproteobacteria bacterium]|nr:MAG: 2-oxoacid:ferredoxin oxidoreductase subunit gamma [Deltaproteobacteria bacterium]
MNYASIMAGFGGQGILMIGNLLSIGALEQGLGCTYFPSYGVEMRGGTANCTVTISDKEVGSPVTARPDGVVAMNGPSVDKFGPRVKEGGFLLINTDMAQDETFSKDGVEVLRIRCNTIATELGNAKLASMVALGAFVARTGIVTIDSVVQALPRVLPEKAHKLIPLNEEALRAGAKYAADN